MKPVKATAFDGKDDDGSALHNSHQEQFTLTGFMMMFRLDEARREATQKIPYIHGFHPAAVCL